MFNILDIDWGSDIECDDLLNSASTSNVPPPVVSKLFIQCTGINKEVFYIGLPSPCGPRLTVKKNPMESMAITLI